jgi:hypothetical protein
MTQAEARAAFADFDASGKPDSPRAGSPAQPPDLDGRIRRRSRHSVGDVPADEHPLVDQSQAGGCSMTTITKQIHFAIKSRRKTAMPGPAPQRNEPAGRTPRVSKLMALAIRFDQLLHDGKVADQSELARLAHVTQPRMTQIMNLLHLAPDIQEAILHLPPVAEGRDPITERDLRPIARMWNWQEQRARVQAMWSSSPS